MDGGFEHEQNWTKMQWYINIDVWKDHLKKCFVTVRKEMDKR